jgi:hypothetical protein
MYINMQCCSSLVTLHVRMMLSLVVEFPLDDQKEAQSPLDWRLGSSRTYMEGLEKREIPCFFQDSNPAAFTP